MGIRAHDAARISIEPEIFPLIVDLDETLTKTDLLHENFFESLTQGLKRHVSACIVVRQGNLRLHWPRPVLLIMNCFPIMSLF
jgi:hypothetical protein